MKQLLMIGRQRKDGKDVILKGDEKTKGADVIRAFKDLASKPLVSDEYEYVIVIRVEPIKRARMITSEQKKRQDIVAKSPTFEAYVAAGNKPETYPPEGCVEKQTVGLVAFRLKQKQEKEKADKAKAKAEAEAKAKADAEEKAKAGATAPQPPATPPPASPPPRPSRR